LHLSLYSFLSRSYNDWAPRLLEFLGFHSRSLVATSPVFAVAMLAVALVASNPLHTETAQASPVAQTIAQQMTSAPAEPPRQPQAPAPPPPPPAPARADLVTHKLPSTLTFYDCVDQGFCGAMANGEDVYEGAAACSYNLAFGTRFVIPGDPTGRTYICKDRGLLPDTHVDIFWHHPDNGWDWQSRVGSQGVIEIVETCEITGPDAPPLCGLPPAEPPPPTP
jgi:hypothetical protein